MRMSEDGTARTKTFMKHELRKKHPENRTFRPHSSLSAFPPKTKLTHRSGSLRPAGHRIRRQHAKTVPPQRVRQRLRNRGEYQNCRSAAGKQCRPPGGAQPLQQTDGIGHQVVPVMIGKTRLHGRTEQLRSGSKRMEQQRRPGRIKFGVRARNLLRQNYV